MADDITGWLERLGLGRYAQAFADNDIEFSNLARLTEDDLKELGLSIGHRRTLQSAIETLSPDGLRNTPEAPATKGPAQTAEAERRQLTVMFCDLVGSTELSSRLDPEDLRQIMQRYQDVVSGCVARYGGHVAKFLGDGVLVYFGWPRAYEDQAERAVRAGLDAIDAIGELEIASGPRLTARVGIATGLVVVGDLVGTDAREADAVTGATPNLAARLQAVAVPGQVVIGEETYRLAGAVFQTESLGRFELKGFADTVPAWHVTAERAATSRFEATHATHLLRLHGRDSELALLIDRWRLACDGEGQIVLISGEPGIGKSRLLQALSDGVKESAVLQLRYQCSAYHDNTALYPVIQHVAQAARFAAGDDNDTKLAKMEAVVHGGERRAGFADLLSLDYADRYSASDLGPQERKERTLRALTDQLLEAVNDAPLLFLFEDAHWIDPTTLELLDAMARKITEAKILMVVTHRPEWQAPFLNQPHTTMLTLNRLGRRQGGDIVREIAETGLPDEVIGNIVQRADGVPLFIEELTKAVIERGANLDALDIPSTLQASLLARLDRLGVDAKEVAQIASVIGREFDFGLLRDIAARPDAALTNALDKLAGSELVFRSGEPPDARFTFKHALVQDAAYDSLLRERRRELHECIADALGRRTGTEGEAAPDTMAFHLSRAERHADAIAHWCAAGEQAVKVFALKESTAQFENGLEALEHIAQGPERDRMELRLRRGLGMPLMVTRGVTADDVERNQTRAYELSRALDSKVDTARVGWGLFHICEMAGRWHDARSHADEIMAISESIGDADLIFQARHAQWSYRGLVGDFTNALKYAEMGWETYDRQRHHTQAYEFGWHDPGCCAGNYLGWCNANLGYPDRAIRSIEENEAICATLGHVSLAFFHSFSAMTNVVMRRFDEVERHARAAIAIGEEHGLRPLAAMSSIFLARARLQSGDATDAAEAASTIERILSRHRAGTQPRVFMPMHLVFLAEAYLALGHQNEGLAAIHDARRFAEMEEELAWWPEILRVEARLTRVADGNANQSETLLRDAINLANSLEAQTLKLRCSADLALLQAEHGDRQKARATLEPAYNWFTEGFDTADLKEAKALLDGLS
jgi:class 3 adenylate cyclase